MTSRTNILFILQTLRTGGSERVVVDLCRRLDRARFDCFVVSLVDGALRETLRQMGIPTLLPRMRSARRDALNVMREISNFIGVNSIHVVNAHHFTPFFYGFYGARRHGCRIFYTVHSRHEVDPVGIWWAMFAGLMFRFSDGVIGISPDVSEAVRQRFALNGRKVLTLPNAIDHDRFAVKVDVGAKKRELGIDETDQVIGCVGNLRKDKNYPNLIKALKIIGERRDGVKLIIAGEGKRKNEIETLIGDLGLGESVRLLGARKDIPEIMKMMDVYCLCSLREGLPLSLLEAMSAGLPVVGTNVVGIKDVVHHGRTGLLVESNDPGKLSEALLRVLADRKLAGRLGEEGRRYALREHGTEKWVERYERLFSPRVAGQERSGCSRKRAVPPGVIP